MKPLVDATFIVPQGIDHPEFRVRPLSEAHASLDFEAVMVSKPRLGSVFSGPWPEDVNSFDDNLRDIREHIEEAQRRVGFSFTVLNHDESRCLGCIYIYPSHKQGYDAAVYFWVHVDVMDTEFESTFGNFVHQWIQSEWPFHAAAFPGRDIPWKNWLSLPERSLT